jgi:hypothetical protein
MAEGGRVDPVWQRAIFKLYTAAKSFQSLRASFWLWQNDPAGFQSSGMWLALASLTATTWPVLAPAGSAWPRAMDSLAGAASLCLEGRKMDWLRPVLWLTLQ